MQCMLGYLDMCCKDSGVVYKIQMNLINIIWPFCDYFVRADPIWWDIPSQPKKKQQDLNQIFSGWTPFLEEFYLRQRPTWFMVT